MKNIVLILLLFPVFSLVAQEETDYLRNDNINKKYLEYLIKKGIDSVRLAHGLKTLVNDSILYVAADHHAKYLLTGKFAHEEDVKTFKTPQDRAEYYGANVNYHVGENIILSYFNTPIAQKKTKGVKINSTYKEMADDFVQGWINSKPHFQNMLTPSYQVTAVAISINPKTNQIFAVQKFAFVSFKYVFEENTAFFNYSDYKPSAVVTSFDQIDQRLHSQTHEWNLKSMDTNSFQYRFALQEINSINTPLQWEVQGNNIYLVGEYNADAFENYFRNKKDGIAVEIVSYTPFDCGNPEYYTQQSRRNHQCEFSGLVLQPLYKKDVLNYFRPKSKKTFKRIEEEVKKNKDDGFFLKVLRGYKKEYTPTSCRIKMGKIPKDFYGYLEFNLVYIKNGGVAKVAHFTNYCGDFYSEFYPLNYIKDFPDSNYTPVAYEKEYQFEFQFKQGESDYRYTDLKPLMDSLTDDAFIILNAEVEAFSSVEGNEKINKNLQEKRAQNLIKALQENQQYTIKPSIQTSSNWSAFKTQIDTTKALAHLKNLSNQILLDSLKNTEFVKRIEPYLAKQRLAKIKIRTRYDLNDKTMAHFLKKEHERLYAKLNEKHVDSAYLQIIDTLELIQKYTYQKVQDGVIAPKVLLQFSCCGKEKMFKMYNNMFCFQEEYKLKKSIDGSTLKDYLVNQSYDVAGANYLIYVIKNWDSTSAPQGISMSDLQTSVENYFTFDSTIAQILPKLGLDYSFKAVQYYYHEKKYDEMLKNISYIYAYYQHYKPDEATALRLAKAFTTYHARDFAEGILKPFVDSNTTNTELLAYYATITYINSIEYKDESYAKWLMEIYPLFNSDDWCKIFIGECLVSFQVLDSEAVRNFYCEKCAHYKNDAESPEKWIKK